MKNHLYISVYALCLQVVGCCWRFLISILPYAGQTIKTFKSGRPAEGTSQSSEGHDHYDAVYA